MGRKRQRVQTRCDPETIDALHEYIDENEVSQAEAVRRLIRVGLHIHGYEIKEYEQAIEHQRARSSAYLAGAVLLVLFGLLVGLFVGVGVI